MNPALAKTIAALTPAVAELVLQLVRAIVSSPDPRATAKRALEEALRLRMIDEALRARKKKSKR